MHRTRALTVAPSIQGASEWATAEALAVGSNGGHPQLAPADFERALTINDSYGGLTVNVPEVPFWPNGADAFVYRRTSHGERQFMLVDVATGMQRPAFDQSRLAAALNRASHNLYHADHLPFDHFELSDDGRRLGFQIEDIRWSCDLASYECTNTTFDSDNRELWPLGHNYVPVQNNPDSSRLSPDGKWIVYIKHCNVFLRSEDGLRDVPLSRDGAEDNCYVVSTLSWSPDSRHLAAYRVRPGYKREVPYLNSSTDQLGREYSTRPYRKPGDVLPLPQPVLFDIADGRQIVIDNALFSNVFELSPPQWWADGRGFTFEYNQRGHQLYRLVEVDAATGRARSLIEETSETFVDYPPLGASQEGTGKIFRYDVDDGKEIIWASERDGYEHLYLFNGRTGALENQITRGEWVVRRVDYIDPIKRQIWFEASGMNSEEDPYFVHAYSIGFDGKGLTALTPDPANHHIEFSPDGRYYVDLWSRIDLPPRMALYRASDNAKLKEIETADVSELVAAGWQPPLSFHSKGRDGKTDVWGVIHLPADFDPSKKYPVVENIYAGPHGSFVPKSFSGWTEPLTQLGFVVAQIDGMGTNNRSRAFHDVAWKNLKDAGFPDRILWHKAAAARYPWYDTSNVGIFGASAGGQSAVSALLFHADFYKVAVAENGCYDNRIDKICWNELWMGWPVGIEYSQSSAVDNAYRLEGRLMIAVGEMDDNVDPFSSFQLADRLVKAGKDFEMVYVPGADHYTLGIYTEHKLLDFFVRNILGQTPPNWNDLFDLEE